jgi:polysaccharide export outer membrane protein
MKDPVIVQNAVAVGWPAPLVVSTMAYVTNEPKAAEAAPPADSAAAVSKPGTPAPPAPVMPATAPAAAPKPAEAAPGATVEPPSLPRDRGVPEDYVIGAGDVLQISVWREPDASVPTVVVRPDGKISMPLLKDVEVVGLTARQAEAVITEGLSNMIKGVDVTIIVTAINSKKVYIVGAAKKEGPLPFTYRMTVMQAISEAGGLTDYAKRKKIYVLHTDNGKEYRLPFNYDEVIRGEKMEQNIQLSPGDTLFIPH